MSDNSAANILQAAKLLFQPGDLVEVRVPKARREKTISGYFDDLEKLAEAVVQLEAQKFPGIYWTLNPIDRTLDLQSRSFNKVKPFAGETTSDRDILKRHWLLVDIDPRRAAGISSTHAEHDGALNLARSIRADLLRAGWPEPIFADSGNGAHLDYAVDLPNDAKSAELLKAILYALALKYNTPADSPGVKIEIDRTTFNASRISKIYGTTARKGDSTTERPHRLARIVEAPALVVPVGIELLVALIPEKKTEAKRPVEMPRDRARAGGRRRLDLRQFLSKHGIAHWRPKPYDGGTKYALESCPFNPAHKAPDSFTLERSDGALVFHCSHNSCSGNGWKEFRLLFEPDAYRVRSAGGQPPTPYPADVQDQPPGDEAGEEETVGPDAVKALVDEAIERGDLDGVLLLIPAIARLDSNTTLRIKAALEGKFKRRFHARDFERELRAERRRGFAGFPPEDPGLPVITVNNRPMRDTVAESLQALRAANDPPFLFVRSAQMVFIESDENGRPSIVPVVKAHLRGRLDRAANYIHRGVEADVSVPPPLEVVDDILALPSSQWGVPPLEFVIEVPTLREDGTVLSSPGYDPISRMLFMPARNFKMEPIPEHVDSVQLKAAIELIDEAVGDFPFADERDEKGIVFTANPSRANVFGLLLTPIVRPAISGCVPIALIDAPQAGTGKSLLVDLFSVITTGRNAAMMPFPRNEEEMQKSIGSTLLEGRSLVCFDNVEGILQSSTLALALTAKEYGARILGESKNMLVPNRATWLATGNNIRPSGDMPRRCYHVRLDAKKSRPFQGRTFKHENLLDWAREARPQLLRALLIIARAWYQRKVKVPVTDPLGSFEAWHRTIGGILRSAGIEGFLANLKRFLEEADDMSLQWESFLREIEEVFEASWFTVGKIIQEIRNATTLQPARFTLPDSLSDVDRRKEGSLERALGKSFAKRIGTRYGESELHLDRQIDKHNKQSEWRVLKGEVEPVTVILAPKPNEEDLPPFSPDSIIDEPY